MGGFSSTAQALQQAITLSDTPPNAEAKVPNPGMMNEAVRADHQHPRLTSSTNHTLDANGFVTVTFTRTFDTEPAINLTAIGSGTSPIPDFRAEFIKTGALWTGATIFGQRNRSLPVITPLNTGLSLLSTLITGLNSIFSAMSGFAAYEPAAGAQVSCVVIKNSSV
jgi:hypothetical protein